MRALGLAPLVLLSILVSLALTLAPIPYAQGSVQNNSTPSYVTFDTPSPSSLTALPVDTCASAYYCSGINLYDVFVLLEPHNAFGANCESPPSSVDLCNVTFDQSIMGPSAGLPGAEGLSVYLPLLMSLSGQADGTMNTIKFTIGAGSSITPGVYSVTLTANYQIQTPLGTGPIIALSQSVTIPIVVQDFTIATSPAAGGCCSTFGGGTVASVITVTGLNGFTGTVTFKTTVASDLGTEALGCVLSETSVALNAIATNGSTMLSCSYLGGLVAGSSGWKGAVRIGASIGRLVHTVSLEVIISSGMSIFAGRTIVVADEKNLGGVAVRVNPDSYLLGSEGAQVSLNAIVSPPTGLACAISPTKLNLASNLTSILSCNGSAGVYQVKVEGTLTVPGFNEPYHANTVVMFTVESPTNSSASQSSSSSTTSTPWWQQYWYLLIVGTSISVSLAGMIWMMSRKVRSGSRSKIN